MVTSSFSGSEPVLHEIGRQPPPSLEVAVPQKCSVHAATSPERRRRCVGQVRADEAALRTDVMRLASRYGYRRIITAAPATASSLADYVLHPPPRLLIGQRAPAAAHVLGEVLGVRRGRDGSSNRRVREDVLEEELTPRLAVER